MVDLQRCGTQQLSNFQLPRCRVACSHTAAFLCALLPCLACCLPNQQRPSKFLHNLNWKDSFFRIMYSYQPIDHHPPHSRPSNMGEGGTACDRPSKLQQTLQIKLVLSSQVLTAWKIQKDERTTNNYLSIVQQQRRSNTTSRHTILMLVLPWVPCPIS